MSAVYISNDRIFHHQELIVVYCITTALYNRASVSSWTHLLQVPNICMFATYSYKHRPRICNIYCFSTATIRYTYTVCLVVIYTARLPIKKRQLSLYLSLISSTYWVQVLRVTLHLITLDRTPLDEGSARCKELYLTTQHSQETDTHAHSGIRTHNPSKWVTEEPRLRQRGHCEQLNLKSAALSSSLFSSQTLVLTWLDNIIFVFSAK